MAKNYWIKKWGARLIWILPIIPIPILSVRFAGHSVYFYTADGELASVYNETYVAIYHSIAGPSVVLSTSAISFILAITTILRYQYLFKQYKTVSSTMKQDILLFCQAFVVLIFQLSLASYYIMRLIATAKNLPELQAFALQCFGYITDVSSLCNPIILLLVCKFIKNDYINFIFHRNSITSISVRNSSVANNNTNQPLTLITVA
uniref:Serpentine receptor class gamma n=1 Tax=Panagrolaimus sp. PS1159 TaxID=55785 RepID=A0AC35FDR7_9BILA